MSEAWVGFLLYVAILAAIVVWGLRRTKRTEVAVWAERYGLSPSEAGAELIERYLSWTRRWRMTGTLTIRNLVQFPGLLSPPPDIY